MANPEPGRDSNTRNVRLERIGGCGGGLGPPFFFIELGEGTARAQR
jgi:hypothetical protein